MIRTKLPVQFFLALTCLTTFLGLSASAGPFINGSFELPGGIDEHTYVSFSPGDSKMVGWTIGGDWAVTYHHRDIPPLDFLPVDGAYQLVFNGGGGPAGTWISQTFDTTIGEEYVVTFHVGRLGEGSGQVSLTATVRRDGGEILASLIAVPPFHGYGGIQQLLFKAVSDTTTLEFLDTSIGRFSSEDIVLDDVRVSVVQPKATIQVSQVAISWDSVSNRLYQVQYRSNVDSPEWMNLGSPVSGNGGRRSVFDSALDHPVRIYRVTKVS